MQNKPKRKPPHDLSVRLGDKKALKGKLQKIARSKQLSMNRLLISIIEEWLEQDKEGKKALDLFIEELERKKASLK